MKRVSIIIPRITEPNISCPYGYIYITTNTINGKKYIGQHNYHSVNKQYLGSGILLQKAIKKYGKENFISEPIDWAENKEELNQKEIWWIDFLGATVDNQYYNIHLGGSGQHPGKYHPLYGRRGKNAVRYGKHLSEETKQKISNTLIKSGKFKGKNNPNYGKPMSKEQKIKLYDNIKNNPNYGMRGKHHSDNTKRKMSKNNNMRKNTKAKYEARQRMLLNNPVKLGKLHPLSKNLYQYSLTGEFISHYDYISEVKDYGYNVVAVRNCLAGNQKQHKGYLWSYLSPIDGKIPSVENEQCYQNSYKQS